MQTTKDLAAILSQRDPVKYKHIIDRALINGYHDFKHHLVPGHPEYGDCCPKIQLVEDMGKFDELSDLVQNVIDGKYDEAPDEEDRVMINEMLQETGMADGLAKAMGFK